MWRAYIAFSNCEQSPYLTTTKVYLIVGVIVFSNCEAFCKRRGQERH